MRTYTDLATMEAANEAARRAVNGILRAERSAAEPCALWPLHEPEPLGLFRAQDRRAFRRGEPWSQGAAAVGGAALAQLSAALGPGEPGQPGQQDEPAAESARFASGLGLRRLRIR